MSYEKADFAPVCPALRRLGVLAAVLAMVTAPASAQTSTRLRGIIAAVAGDQMRVRTADGRHVEIALTSNTNLVFAQPIALSEIKAGDFLGVTSSKRSDGTLSAFDVRRFPRVVNPGHRSFDGRDDQTMTNATVSATVSATQGRALVLSYQGGSQNIVVSETASFTTLVAGERSQLVPGAPVSVLADRDAAGRLSARSVEVREAGVKPTR